ncbi:MAG: N-acetylmuramoyl-L-alanine amidase [Cyanobacteriota bacterium]|nr:N-acetylmuramoyl-L-alanine amidase [Cyanobacteriota bacterium]
MGRIFLSAGHGGFENGVRDPGVIAGGTTEAQEMIWIRDLVAGELRSRSFQVYAVPDDLSQVGTVDWINYYTRSGDVALELQSGGSSNPNVRGVTVFYIARNTERQRDAQQLLMALLRRVPQFPSRGTKPDTATGLGRLIFCRWIVAPSLYLEIGYLTNPQDRALIQSRRQDIAKGIADGVVGWILGENITPAPPVPPNVIVYGSIGIKINGQFYGERGILLQGNSYIPIDLVDRLGINLAQMERVRRVRYRNIVYVRAIDLRDFGISVTWENSTRSVVLRSFSRVYADKIDQIMGNGITTEMQRVAFIKSENVMGLYPFPELAHFYQEEANLEGVNYDIAFCQMCLETEFLRFGRNVTATQNNFAGLGTVGGSAETASFATPRLGVRAHIQHLKAYASTEPLVQEIIDPRFHFVMRGIAPSVLQLSGRWSDDLQYGNRILALMQRLYEVSKVL